MDNKSKNSILRKYTVTELQAGATLEEYLKQELKLSARSRQKLFFSKTVYVNGRSTHSQYKIKAGDTIGVREFLDANYGVTPEKGNIEIIYEDADVIVLNKPAGILVHPAGQTRCGTLANYLAYYFKQKQKVYTIRPLHRLDRDTTGCVLFAKSAKAQAKLEQELAQGNIHRRYEALVVGKGEKLAALYPDGRINLPIGRDRFKPNQRTVVESGQAAVTNFKQIGSCGSHVLLELELETGKTHQIRVHLSYIGFPVLGDKMYGSASKLIKRQALHAKYLEFNHPITGEHLKLEAPRPIDFKNAVNVASNN